MRIAIIALVATMLVLAACGPTEPQAGEPTMPVVKEPAKEPVKQEAPIEKAPEEYTELTDIERTMQDADIFADELNFTELDSLDNELKELESLDFE